MASEDEVHSKQENFQTSIQIVVKSWQSIKDNVDMYREEIAHAFFEQNPQRHQIFEDVGVSDVTTEAAVQRKLLKHSTSVINFMEAIVDFVNGNEESKPMYFLLGKHHKHIHVNEKMFIEMKEAICKIIKRRLKDNVSVSWGIVLEYIYINYIFQGMHMIETL